MEDRSDAAWGPQSRVLLTKVGYIQGYNAQAAVDGAHQIIVSQDVTPSMSDQAQLVPLLDAIETNLGRQPEEASADSGYLSEANLASLQVRGIRAYIATGRAKHPADAKRRLGGELTQTMRRKLKRAGWRRRHSAPHARRGPPSGRLRSRSSRAVGVRSACACYRSSAPSGD